MLDKIKSFITRIINDDEKTSKRNTYDFYEVHKDALNRDWTEKRIEEVKIIEEKKMEKNKNEIIRLKQKFPILMNDIIIMQDGRKYRVCKKTIKGITTKYEVKLKWENRPNNYNEQDKVECIALGSLRELSYYLEQELDEIKEVIKSFDTEYEKFKTMEEMHEEALIENERIKKLKKKTIQAR